MMDVLCDIKELVVPGVDCVAPRLDSVSLRIFAEHTALLGDSGAGKTTLLNVLAGFERDFRGKVEWSAEIAKKGRRGIFWAPSEGGLWPHMTALEHLLEVAPPSPAVTPEELFSSMGLGGKENVRPALLSKGERARLSLARALAAAPRLLLLDEPLLNVSPAARVALWDTVVGVAETSGAVLLHATHAPECVVGSAVNALVLHAGRVVFDGLVEDLYLRPPDVVAGRALGTLNVFDGETLKLLGMEEQTGSRTIMARPEMVVVAPHPEGEFVVKQSVFRGNRADTTLTRVDSGALVKVSHRPRVPLETGTKVSLTLLGRH